MNFSKKFVRLSGRKESTFYETYGADSDHGPEDSSDINELFLGHITLGQLSTERLLRFNSSIAAFPILFKMISFWSTSKVGL